MTGAAESDVEWLASLGWAVKNTQKQVTLGDQNVRTILSLGDCFRIGSYARP